MLGINGNNHTVMAVDADATIEVVNHRHDSSADSVDNHSSEGRGRVDAGMSQHQR